MTGIECEGSYAVHKDRSCKTTAKQCAHRIGCFSNEQMFLAGNRKSTRKLYYSEGHVPAEKQLQRPAKCTPIFGASPVADIEVLAVAEERRNDAVTLVDGEVEGVDLPEVPIIFGSNLHPLHHVDSSRPPVPRYNEHSYNHRERPHDVFHSIKTNSS